MNRLTKGKEHTSNQHSHHRSLMSFNDFFNEALKDFYSDFSSGGDLERLENRALFPAMDIVEADDHYNLQVEMPGMGEEDIEVAIQGNRLTIRGEKSTSTKNKDKNYLSREIQYGSYERSIVLPASAEVDKATASFKKGMLWVKIPKKMESQKNTRKIKIDKA